MIAICSYDSEEEHETARGCGVRKGSSGIQKIKGTCTSCCKIGHKTKACYNRLNEEKNRQEKCKPKQ